MKTPAESRFPAHLPWDETAWQVTGALVMCLVVPATIVALLALVIVNVARIYVP